MHVEWLRFLKQIERETSKGLDVHFIADNYATHKHPKVKAWLAKRPRIKMHFIPTSLSWLDLVERIFRDLIEKEPRYKNNNMVKASKYSRTCRHVP